MIEQLFGLNDINNDEAEKFSDYTNEAGENLIDNPEGNESISDVSFLGNNDTCENPVSDINADTQDAIPKYDANVVYDQNGIKITEYTADLGGVEATDVPQYKTSDYTLDSYVIAEGECEGMTRPERLDLNASDAIEANSDNIIGEPVSDMQNHHEQEMPNSCAIACQEYAIESLTGQELDESELREIGKYFGYSDERGTPFGLIGLVAEQYGLDAEYCSASAGEGLTLENAMERVENGEKLIVGADTSKLYYPDNAFSSFLITQPNHAIEIIGFDKTDPNDIKVIVNDPGFEDGAGNVYSWNDFSKCCDTDFVTIHK